MTNKRDKFSLKLSKEKLLTIIEPARYKKGWTATAQAWCEAAGVSVSTLERFRAGKAISAENFINLCTAVGVENWKDVVNKNCFLATTLNSQSSTLTRQTLASSDCSENSFQNSFLEELIEQIFPYLGEIDLQQDCFHYRFHPQNREISNLQVVSDIQKSVEHKFSIEQFEQILTQVIHRLVNVLKDELLADGVNIQAFNHESTSENKDSWKPVFDWLWSVKFPREGWRLLTETALEYSDKFKMESSSNFRDLKLNKALLTPENIKKEHQYYLKINLSQNGYLLLINQGVSGDRYCICPSKLYTFNQQVKLDQTIRLPLDNSPEKALVFSDIGEENFWAIITKRSLNLSWIKSNYNPEDIINYVQIDDSRLREIFQLIGKQYDTLVYSTKFIVID